MSSALDGAVWGVDFTPDQWAAVDAAVDRQCAAMEGQPKKWFGTVSGERVQEVLRSGAFELILIRGYLLAMSIDVPWWSAGDKVLYEQLLLKVDPAASNIRPVIKALIHCATITGAAGVAAGTSLNPSDRKLARVYERFGFSTAAHSLYLEI
jgi:hypothetical protein